ncbi:hypothetical protein BHM03_00033243 [Ensete ventricosum]|nr:hypothetical protein BHM03_00033243 [Ensete ventricosum]
MSYEHGFMKKNTLLKVTRKVEIRSVFCAPSPKFKILAIPNVLAHGRSYEYNFEKKHDDHKHCTKSREAEFQSVFRALSPKLKMLAILNLLAQSQKFKILAIPNVLTHEKSYEHGFVKKRDGHEICAKSHAKSSFVHFFVHRLKNSKY